MFELILPFIDINKLTNKRLTLLDHVLIQLQSSIPNGESEEIPGLKDLDPEKLEELRVFLVEHGAKSRDQLFDFKIESRSIRNVSYGQVEEFIITEGSDKYFLSVGFPGDNAYGHIKDRTNLVKYYIGDNLDGGNPAWPDKIKCLCLFICDKLTI